MSDPSVSRCKNCQTSLVGRYCHTCGQVDRDLDRPFLAFLREWLSSALGLDSRLLRTLIPLLTRPGLVTEEYLAGRRARYVPPIRLYFFISLLMFLTLAWTGYSVVQTSEKGGGDVALPQDLPLDENGESEPPEEVVGSEEPEGSFTKEEESEREDPAEDGEDPTEDGEDVAAQESQDGTGEDDGDEDWEFLLAPLLQDPEAFDRIYRERLAQTLFILVPVFAGLTRLFFRRRYSHYVQHLILSLHLHSVTFLGVTLGILLDPHPDTKASGPASSVLTVAILVYYYRALGRVFGEGRWKTGWKGSLILVLHLMALVFTFLGTLILAALWM